MADERNYHIPINYNEGKLKLLGYVSIRALIESVILTAIVAPLLYFLISKISNPFVAVILIGMIFVGILVVNVVGINGETIFQVLMHIIEYKTKKRQLQYRRIQKRIHPKKDIHQEEEKVQPLWTKFLSKKALEELNKEEEEEEDDEENQADDIGKVFGDIAKQMTRSSFKKKEEKYTQEIVPIKAIRDGVVITKDNVFIKVLEFNPINLFNLTPEKRNSIIANFGAFLSIANVDLQFKVIRSKANPDRFNNYLVECLKDETSEGVFEAANELMYMLNLQSQGVMFERRFFLIIKHKKGEGLLNKESIDVAIDILNEEVYSAINSMANCGAIWINHIDQDGVSLEDLFLYNFFYEFYNKRSSGKKYDEKVLNTSEMTQEEIEKAQKEEKENTFRYRYQKVYQDSIKAQETNSPKIKSHHFVAPRGVDFGNRVFMTMDGYYYTYLTFKDYPSWVYGGWLAAYTNEDYLYDIDIILHRENKKQIQEKISNSMNAKIGTDAVTPMNSVASREVERAYLADQYLMEGLQSGCDFYYFMIVLTIYDRTYKGLMRKKRKLSDMFNSSNFTIEGASFNTEQFFETVTPICTPNKSLFDRYKRNVLTEGAASLFPFVSETMQDEKGIPIGIIGSSKSPLLFDPFDREKHAHGNGFILGQTGYGKTFLTMLLALRLRLIGTQVFILCPSKGHEYEALAKQVDGKFVDVSQNCINIMEILPVHADLSLSTDDDEGFNQNKSLVKEKINEQLIPFFSILIPNMDKLQRTGLNAILTKIYNNYGMFDDNNDSIYIDNDPNKGLKKMPILQDVYEELKVSDKDYLRRIADFMTIFTEGTMKYFNGQTKINLNNKLLIFDLTSIASEKKETFPLGLFIVQNYIWSVIRQGKGVKKAIFYDEIWKMFEVPQVADTIREVYKTIRGFGGISMAATQQISDFTNNAAGKAIISCSTFRALFKMETDNAREAQKEIGCMKDQDVEAILSLRRGQALITIEDDKYYVNIMGTDLEKRIFNTN